MLTWLIPALQSLDGVLELRGVPRSNLWCVGGPAFVAVSRGRNWNIGQ